MNGGQLIKGHVPMGETSFPSLRGMTQHRFDLASNITPAQLDDMQIFHPNFLEIFVSTDLNMIRVVFSKRTGSALNLNRAVFGNACVEFKKRGCYCNLICVKGLLKSNISIIEGMEMEGA